MSKSSNYFDSTMALVPASFVHAVKAWKIAGAQGAEGGVRTHPLTVGGSEVMLQMQGCASPFDASSLSGGSRKTLTLRLPQVWDEPFGLMETAMIKEVAAKSATLFGKQLSETELLEIYKPISKKQGEYPRNLRVKVNLEGFYASRYWDGERKKVETPADHTGLVFNVAVRLRSLWISADSSSWGVVCEATDLQMLTQQVADCPF